MKSSRLLVAFVILAIFTFAVSSATAGGMGNGAAQRQKLVIDSIDATAGRVECKSMVDNTVHTFKIEATTHIVVGANMAAKATIDQLKVGQKVANYLAKDGPPPQTLTLLMVSSAPPIPSSPAPTP